MVVNGIFLVIAACTMCNTSFAGTKELSDAVMQSAKYNQLYMPKSDRENLAADILHYWTNLESRVPSLSPNESEWLSGELQGSEDRVRRAINTIEFWLQQSGNIVRQCVDAVGSLIDRRPEYISSPNLETFGWIKVSRCYTKSEELRDYLRQAGLSDGRADGSFHMMFNSIILDRIIDSVTISSLADAEGWTIE